MMKRRRITLAITGIVLLVLITGGAIVIRKGFHAETVTPTADLTVSVTVDGQTDAGQLEVRGDCPDTYAQMVNDSYYCQLTPPPSGDLTVPPPTSLTINSLSFYDYDKDQNFVIPISNNPSAEGRALSLAPNEQLILNVTIDTTAKTLVTQRIDTKTGQPVAFP